MLHGGRCDVANWRIFGVVLTNQDQAQQLQIERRLERGSVHGLSYHQYVVMCTQ